MRPARTRSGSSNSTAKRCCRVFESWPRRTFGWRRGDRTRRLDGKRVATIIGYVWAPYLQKWSAPGTALFPDEVTTVQALLNGQVQGYVNGTGGRVDPRMIAHALHPGDFGFPEPVLANIDRKSVVQGGSIEEGRQRMSQRDVAKIR